MNFTSKQFTDLEKIQLLQRSILVNSYAYYELNENILSDHQYDMNTRQLLQLKRDNPEVYKQSRYYDYFDNFESGTGFDLSSRIKKDQRLYKNVSRDAYMALEMKKGRESKTS